MRSRVKKIRYGENRAFVRNTSRGHRDDSLRKHGNHGRHGSHAVRETNADSAGCGQYHNIRDGHNSDGDKGAYLRYTLDGSTPTGGSSGNGTEITASKGTVLVEFGVGPKGTTLKAIAYKERLADSLIAVGNYVYQSPY
jgi:Fn3 associated